MTRHPCFVDGITPPKEESFNLLNTN